MARRKEPPVDKREETIAKLIGEGFNITEISEKLEISRQAVWEFCARRGWLGDESLAKIEAKDERRRESRRSQPAHRADNR